MPRASFTLIELLIVIAIVAVLAVTIILTLNPSQLVKQARDSTRLSDLATINQAISLYQVDQPSGSLGTASTTYVSIADPQATTTAGTECQGLSLPSLPSGWTYHCSSSSTLRQTNGTGWIPVNFSQISAGSPFSSLPIDPTNTTSSGNYYTYTPGGSWQLTAIPESQKYKTTSNPINLDGVLLAGNDFTLSPLYNTNGLVGWWKFDEGSGSVAKDYSTNGNSGFLVNGPSWTAGRLAGGINFGDSRYINISANIINPGQGSISFWTKHGWDPLDNITHGWFQTDQGVNNPGWISFYKYGANNLDFRVRNNDVCCYATAGTGLNEASLYLIANQWTHITGTWDYSGAKLYVNGTLISSAEFGGLGVPTVSTSIITLGVGHGASLNGIMDDVRIYNRALSAAEVKAIYDATK